MSYNFVPFNALVGKTLVSVTAVVDGEVMIFTTDSGERYQLCHAQDCCESVGIVDIEGDLSDIVGSPIVLADEATSNESQPGQNMEYAESFTLTFYRIATVKGFVVVRWLGKSNGYYSGVVDFELIDASEW